jgi:hypothetical protein
MRSTKVKVKTKVKSETYAHIMRNPNIPQVDFYGRMKSSIDPMDVYKTKGTHTRAAKATAPIWIAERINQVYAGTKALDIDRKIAKEKAAALVFRSPTPLPWKVENKIYLRRWNPPTPQDDL